MKMFAFAKQPFPFYFNDQRRNFLLIIAVSLFVALFLTIYQPFKQYAFVELAAYSLICFLVLALNILLLPLWIPQWFEAANWNLQRYIVFNLVNFLAIGIAVSVFSGIFICGWEPLLNHLLVNQMHVALVGIFPLVLITFLIQNRLLHENLQKAKSANVTLKNIQKDHKARKPGLITIQSDISETLSFRPADFIMAQAEDNYTNFFLEHEGKIKSVLLRITLKNTEKQLQFPFIRRCHRSFIVNLLKIDTINGHANGYKLLLTNYDNEIPVSRQNSKSILETIANLAKPADLD